MFPRRFLAGFLLVTTLVCLIEPAHARVRVFGRAAHEAGSAAGEDVGEKVAIGVGVAAGVALIVGVARWYFWPRRSAKSVQPTALAGGLPGPGTSVALGPDCQGAGGAPAIACW